MKIKIQEQNTNVDISEVDECTIIIAEFDVQKNSIEKSLLDAKGDLISATAADTPARVAAGANGQVLMADSAETAGLKWANVSGGDPACLVVLDGGGAAIPTGIWGDIIFPAYLKIKSWTIVTKDTGSITVDIWHCPYSEFNNSTHPVVGDSICPSSKIAISSSYKAQDTDLFDWYPQIVNQFDTWRLNIDLCTGIKKASLLFIFDRL